MAFVEKNGLSVGEFEPEMFMQDNVLHGAFIDENNMQRLNEGKWSNLVERTDPQTKEKQTGKIRIFKDDRGVDQFCFITAKENYNSRYAHFSSQDKIAINNGEFVEVPERMNRDKTLIAKYDPELNDLVFSSFSEQGIPHSIGETELSINQKMTLLNKGELKDVEFTHKENVFKSDIKLGLSGIELNNPETVLIRNRSEFHSKDRLQPEAAISMDNNSLGELETAIKNKDYNKMKSLTLDKKLNVGDDILLENIVKNDQYDRLSTTNAFACLGVEPSEIAKKQEQLQGLADKQAGKVKGLDSDKSVSLDSNTLGKESGKEKMQGAGKGQDKSQKPDKFARDKEKLKGYMKDGLNNATGLMRDL